MKSKQIKQLALASLRDNWGKGVLLSFLYFLITFIPEFIIEILLIPYPEWEYAARYNLISIAISIILIPFGVSLSLSYITLIRESKLPVEELFTGFKYLSFLRALGLTILQSIYIFLWFLLLIIPGIIKSLSYSQAMYILRDRPELSVNKAITESRKMMKGHKWRYFCLNLSFIGWAFLCILTLGIGFLWLGPYFLTAHAHFYEDLRDREGAVAVKEAII